MLFMYGATFQKPSLSIAAIRVYRRRKNKQNEKKKKKSVWMGDRVVSMCVFRSLMVVFLSFHIAAHKCSPSNIEISLSKIFPPKGICRWNRIEEKSGIETYDEMCCWVNDAGVEKYCFFFSYAP